MQIVSVLHGLFFTMIYVTSIVTMGLVMSPSPPPPCYLDCFGAIFATKFLAGRHIKVAIHYVSHSLPLSPLKQQPCLKAQTTEQ
jgi:hypothetical protein